MQVVIVDTGDGPIIEELLLEIMDIERPVVLALEDGPVHDEQPEEETAVEQQVDEEEETAVEQQIEEEEETAVEQQVEAPQRNPGWIRRAPGARWCPKRRLRNKQVPPS